MQSIRISLHLWGKCRYFNLYVTLTNLGRFISATFLDNIKTENDSCQKTLGNRTQDVR